jgi:aspartyl protease family protein
MSDPQGPWGGPPAPHAPRRASVIIWIGVLVAAAAGFFALRRLFPQRLSGQDWAYAAYCFGFIALLSSGLIFRRRLKLREAIRNIAIWVVVVAVLALVVTFRDELVGVGQRVRAEFIPAYAVSTSPHSVALTQSEDGNFYVIGAVNGAPVRFLIDTGASDIVLSPADAARAGVDLAALHFGRAYETANGTGRGAEVTLEHLTVGPIEFSHVPVAINGAPMESSLLGQPFFKRLESFEIRGHRLWLRWRA